MGRCEPVQALAQSRQPLGDHGCQMNSAVDVTALAAVHTGNREHLGTQQRVNVRDRASAHQGYGATRGHPQPFEQG